MAEHLTSPRKTDATNNLQTMAARKDIMTPPQVRLPNSFKDGIKDPIKPFHTYKDIVSMTISCTSSENEVIEGDQEVAATNSEHEQRRCVYSTRSKHVP